MSGLFKNAVNISHQVIAAVVEAGDIVVDATCGRGHDTIFLAQLVGEKGKVYAFDIQGIAIETTWELLQANKTLENVVLIKDNHSNLDSYIPQRIKACMFNLGYLPGGDHSIKTDKVNTLKALEKATKMLDNNGVITIVFYPGHSGGQEELNSMMVYLSELSQKDFEVSHVEFINQINDPPQITIVQKVLGGSK
ncbi:MAG: class I SAM-dependent methyltransferase [Syntrophomonadaceae bacterium]|nr:class I SAM-dependent methyltransferase [Syntrophomonadaceae bacterium]MDD3888498.1 class I SAM-dependent methyltransferase [Syntrophomonadaceae bacterium]MDD4548738.1 class I SAM-dependent methyltransferase [Syntrophomonadaceae bacterium]